MNKLDIWLQRALTTSSSERKRLRDVEKVKVYSLKHLERGATQIKWDRGVELSSRSICNMRKAAKIKAGISTAIRDIIENGRITSCATMETILSSFDSQVHSCSCQRLR